jgi:hypothetical protein
MATKPKIRAKKAPAAKAKISKRTKAGKAAEGRRIANAERTLARGGSPNSRTGGGG